MTLTKTFTSQQSQAQFFKLSQVYSDSQYQILPCYFITPKKLFLYYLMLRSEWTEGNMWTEHFPSTSNNLLKLQISLDDRKEILMLLSAKSRKDELTWVCFQGLIVEEGQTQKNEISWCLLLLLPLDKYYIHWHSIKYNCFVSVKR